jgi:hypothetical protein
LIPRLLASGSGTQAGGTTAARRPLARQVNRPSSAGDLLFRAGRAAALA